eukprot:scaffold926_cov408-Prasinococcus_capsulatus_cf.AAC.53
MKRAGLHRGGSRQNAQALQGGWLPALRCAGRETEEPGTVAEVSGRKAPTKGSPDISSRLLPSLAHIVGRAETSPSPQTIQPGLTSAQLVAPEQPHPSPQVPWRALSASGEGVPGEPHRQVRASPGTLVVAASRQPIAAWSDDKISATRDTRSLTAPEHRRWISSSSSSRSSSSVLSAEDWTGMHSSTTAHVRPARRPPPQATAATWRLPRSVGEVELRPPLRHHGVLHADAPARVAARVASEQQQARGERGADRRTTPRLPRKTLVS